MAAMTVALTEFSDSGNSRTSTLAAHTVLKPQVVVEKRRVPEGNQTVSEYSAKAVIATTDSTGAVLPQKVSMEVTVRFPVNSQAADIQIALTTLRAIIAGDEFANSVVTQNWL